MNNKISLKGEELLKVISNNTFKPSGGLLLITVNTAEYESGIEVITNEEKAPEMDIWQYVIETGEFAEQYSVGDRVYLNTQKLMRTTVNEAGDQVITINAVPYEVNGNPAILVDKSMILGKDTEGGVDIEL